MFNYISEQSLDTGTSKIHVPSNYGAKSTDNDGCGDVYIYHDCPTDGIGY